MAGTKEATAFLVKDSETATTKSVVPLGLDFDQMVESQKRMWFDAIYPIGSVFFSVKGVDPNEGFDNWPFGGLGTWAELPSNNDIACLGIASHNNTNLGQHTGSNNTAPVAESNISAITKTVTGKHTHGPGSGATIFVTATGNVSTDIMTFQSGSKHRVPYIATSKSFKNHTATGATSISEKITIGTKDASVGPQIDPSRTLVCAWYRVS